MRDLKKDLEICRKATPKPWRIVDEDENEAGERLYWIKGPKWVECGEYVYFNQADAHFIAEAREGWPEMIRRAMEAEARAKELETAKETLLDELDWAKRNRDSRIRELEAQRSAAKEALDKLRLMLAKFGWLDGRVWRIIDDALAVLEGGEQDDN